MSNVEVFPLTSRKLTEYEALVAAAPSALDAIPGAVYICDEEGWLVRYNAEAAMLWGRTPNIGHERERFCGSHRLFLLDGTPLANSDCPVADAVRNGTATRNAEVVMERPDGSRFIALVNIRALKDHDGRIQGAINCFQDVSARKQVEEEVRRQAKDLEDFFENSAVGLHIVSDEGLILRANKAELALLGYSAEEYVGRHVAEFHADAPVIGDILQRLSCGEKLDRYPARLRAKDGSIKHVLITSIPALKRANSLTRAASRRTLLIFTRPSVHAVRATSVLPPPMKPRRSALRRRMPKDDCCASMMRCARCWAARASSSCR